MRRLLVLTALLVPALAVAQPITMQDGFAPLVAKVAPAVVNIRTDAGSIGSGVIISSDGLVVTNHHVIARSRRIVVALDGKKILPATRVGSDRENDLALLRLPAGTYPSIPWADSSKVRVGEFALAIGNPLNVGKSVSIGIVSAVGRTTERVDRHTEYIQTDAAVNQGNSGGALINARGELIGINTAILSQSGGNEGIAFAIAANLTRAVVAQLEKAGAAKRGWLGVVLGVSMDGDVGLVDLVRRGPAYRAGLRPNDLLVSINGSPVTDVESAILQISKLKPGDKVPIVAVRSGEKVTVAATVGERPAAIDD